MESLRHAIGIILGVILQIGKVIVDWIVAIELWLRVQFAQFGLSPVIQTTILVVIAVLLVVGSLRFFGGLIRIAVILVLLLIAINILVPAIQP